MKFDKPDRPVYSGQFSDNSETPSDIITVVTYNIQHARKIEQAIAEFREFDPLRDADIVFLQEMDSAGVETMAKTLGYNYIYYPSTISVATGNEFGNAILSKWPVIESEKLILPHKSLLFGSRRNASFATIRIGEKNILACSAHTEFIQFIHRKIDQARAISNSINGNYDHVLVGGDFNTFMGITRRFFDREFKNNGLERITKKSGWTAKEDYFNRFTFELDHIYSRGFELIENGVIREAGASDHRPVWVRISM